MNLDGDISPVCLNILPLASSSLPYCFGHALPCIIPSRTCLNVYECWSWIFIVCRSASLQILPANFLLLSTVSVLDLLEGRREMSNGITNWDFLSIFRSRGWQIKDLLKELTHYLAALCTFLPLRSERQKFFS